MEIKIPGDIRNEFDGIMLHLCAGQMMMGDLEVLYNISKGKKTIVELGTARGFSAMILSVHGGHVTTIDNFNTIVRADHLGVNFAIESHRDKWVRTISDFLTQWNNGNIKVVQGDSATSSNMFEDESVDLIFIDAGHEYPEVKRDYEAWYKKVKIGGMFAFHDCAEIHKGVWKFVHEDLARDIESGHIKELDYTPVCKSVIKEFERLK